jgi:hypothetical protein
MGVAYHDACLNLFPPCNFKNFTTIFLLFVSFFLDTILSGILLGSWQIDRFSITNMVSNNIYKPLIPGPVRNLQFLNSVLRSRCSQYNFARNKTKNMGKLVFIHP